MHQFPGFLIKVIDSVAEHIVVLDREGVIRFTNQAWKRFGLNNGSPVKDDWTGINYLSACDKAAEMGDDFGRKAAEGIRSVIAGSGSFYFEYPCHSPEQKRWFIMSTSRFDYENNPYFIISHINITERKLAEDYTLALANRDGLTGLYNRRFFDKFLNEEWKRCSRLNLPITLAMIDLDHFKLLNDTYGHLYGDDCLKKIALVLQRHAKRPGDICARYGGEEFALLFGNSTAEKLMPVFSKIQEEVKALNLPNERSAVSRIVTLSIGTATLCPERNQKEEELGQKSGYPALCSKDKGEEQD